MLVVGGKPGAAGPVSPWESWFAAEPAYRAGDYERAYEIASAGVRDWPEHPVLHYQLACYRSLAGDVDTALDHLERALAGDPRAHEWAEHRHRPRSAALGSSLSHIVLTPLTIHSC